MLKLIIPLPEDREPDSFYRELCDWFFFQGIICTWVEDQRHGFNIVRIYRTVIPEPDWHRVFVIEFLDDHKDILLLTKMTWGGTNVP